MAAQKLSRPEYWRFEFFTSASGAKIRYGFVHPSPKSSSKGTVVLTGGYGRQVEYYYEAVNNWLERGYSVYAMDWHGQGGSGRDDPKKPHRPSSRDFSYHTDTFHEFVRDHVKPDPAKTNYLCSHSKGGNIMLRYMHAHENDAGFPFTGAILAAPMIDINTYLVSRDRLKKVLNAAIRNGFDDILPGGNDMLQQLYEGAKDSGEARELDKLRRKIHEEFRKSAKDRENGPPTASWLKSAIDSIEKVKEKNFLAAIKTPILMITPENDGLVCIKSQTQAVLHLQNARQIRIAGAKHGVFYDTDAVQKRLWAAIDRFLRDQNKNPPAPGSRRGPSGP